MNQNPDRHHKGTGIQRWIRISIASALFLIILGVIVAVCGYQAPRQGAERLNDLGNWGSYLQGTTAALWALAGVFVIFVAFLVQRQQADFQQEALEEQKKQFEMQHRNQQEALEEQKRQFDIQQKTQETQIARERQSGINGVLHAMLHEQQSLSELHHQTVGRLLDAVEDGKPLDIRIYRPENKSIVYPENTAIVGQIDDPELRKAIVVTYNKCTMFMGLLSINNWYLEQRAEYLQLAQEKRSEYASKKVASLEQNLIKHAPILKKTHHDWRLETQNLFSQINRYLQAHPIS